MAGSRIDAQVELDPDAGPRPAFVLTADYRAGEGPRHSHRRAQLLHASSGVLTITTATGRWIAPPQRAVWIPSGMAHSVSSRRPFRLLTLYIEPELAPLAATCHIVAVDRLVEELLRAAAVFGSDYPAEGPEQRLLSVILDRLPALTVSVLLELVEPTSAALKQITGALKENPADDQTLDAWAAKVGITKRTAARHFLAETRLSFGRWRQQLRLLTAVERLGAGKSVTEVAFEVGYDDVSSFIAAFKATMGKTPAQYFK